MRQYYVYIMTNNRGILYTGVTSDLSRRVYEHKQKIVDGFTKKYNITILIYYEETSDILSTIAREKEIKGWRRSKKIELIESVNPQWSDLSEGWYARESGAKSHQQVLLRTKPGISGERG